MIVVDASAAVELVLQLEAGEVLLDRLFGAGESLHAPELIDIEVAQVIRRYQRAGDITARRGSEAITDLSDLPVQRHPHAPLLERIWQLRQNVTAYDAAYIALAEAMDAVLVTRDRGLARVPGVRATVELV